MTIYVNVVVTRVIFTTFIILFSSHLMWSQVTGEWILEDYPQSEISDVCKTQDGIYILIRSVHDIVDTNKYDYSTSVFRLEFNGDGDLGLIAMYNKNTGSQRFVANRLSNVNGIWILTESTYTNQIQDTFYLNRLDEDFNLLERKARHIHADLYSYSSTIYGKGEYIGIGSILFPPDSLLGVHYSSDRPDSSQIKIFRTIPPPTISFVTSVTYDSSRNRFLVFHLGGISHLNDSLGLIQKYPGSVVHTSQHGTILSDNFRYYSFGATASQGDPSLRDLVFQQYDTSMQIMFSDTFGRIGKDDYPFINRSLDLCNGVFYVGGMLAGPSNLSHQDTLKFFLAKYNTNLELQWYQEYGGHHSFIIRGLLALPDARCLVYGQRVSEADSIRYPYLLVVDEYGGITGTRDITYPDSQYMYVVYSSESSNLTFYTSEMIKELRLFSMDGRSVTQKRVLLPGRYEYDLSFLPSGMYVFFAQFENGNTQTGKWIKP